MHFRDWTSWVIHHTIMRKSSSSTIMVQVLTISAVPVSCPFLVPYGLRATAGCRLLMKTVEGCNCGGKVILDVEAAFPRGVVDRRVLTTDVDAGLGLIPCVTR